jgi:hypothetical protein
MGNGNGDGNGAPSDDGIAVERELACELTDDELRMRGDAMAEAELLVETLKAERRAVNKKIYAAIDERNKLAHVIEAKAEVRRVVCKWIPDYEHNVWNLIRQDKGDCAEQRPMTAADRQGMLPYPADNPEADVDDVEAAPADTPAADRDLDAEGDDDDINDDDVIDFDAPDAAGDDTDPGDVEADADAEGHDDGDVVLDLDNPNAPPSVARTAKKLGAMGAKVTPRTRGTAKAKAKGKGKRKSSAKRAG